MRAPLTYKLALMFPALFSISFPIISTSHFEVLILFPSLVHRLGFLYTEFDPPLITTVCNCFLYHLWISCAACTRIGLHWCPLSDLTDKSTFSFLSFNQWIILLRHGNLISLRAFNERLPLSTHLPRPSGIPLISEAKLLFTNAVLALLPYGL